MLQGDRYHSTSKKVKGKVYPRTGHEGLEGM